MKRRVEVSSKRNFDQEIRVRILVIAGRTVGAALRGRPCVESHEGRPRRAAPTVRSAGRYEIFTA